MLRPPQRGPPAPPVGRSGFDGLDKVGVAVCRSKRCDDTRARTGSMVGHLRDRVPADMRRGDRRLAHGCHGDAAARQLHGVTEDYVEPAGDAGLGADEGDFTHGRPGTGPAGARTRCTRRKSRRARGGNGPGRRRGAENPGPCLLVARAAHRFVFRGPRQDFAADLGTSDSDRLFARSARGGEDVIRRDWLADHE